ncbi:MAG: acyl-CoA synthetase (AMP-forming)/AMP-acid ligase II/acyl carrier protein [Alphaproteobacteria bacterium]|jgi:acyl-CoA synthetase (AMP-forming)/AMP-acid ligase II/acyl carrier protein
MERYVSNRHKNLIEILQSRAKETPAKIIYRYVSDENIEPLTLTYTELDKEARIIAAKLLLHCKKGERVLMLYPSGLAFIKAFWGCLYAGVIAVPASPPRRNQKPYGLKSIINDADIQMVLSTKQYYHLTKRQFETDDDLKQLHWLKTDDALPPKLADIATVYGDQDIAFLQYTSGSTGDPKGVIITHKNIMSNMEVIKLSFGHNEQSVGCSWLPHFHDMGLIGGVLQPLYVGFTVTLLSPTYFLQKPIRWLQIISLYGATTSGGPNFAYDLCVKHTQPKELESLDLSRWQVAFNGAEPVRATSLASFNKKFGPYGFNPASHYPCYGMAETTLLISGGHHLLPPKILTIDRVSLQNGMINVTDEGDHSLAIVSNGTCRSDHKLMIVAPGTQQRLKEGLVGEVLVKGSSVALGYWNKPEQTQAIFNAFGQNNNAVDGQYFRTGDLGFVQDGELYICGREKDIVIVRGCNYYPQDIEHEIASANPALADNASAVFSVLVGHDEKLVLVQEIKRTQLRSLDVLEVFTSVQNKMAEVFELQFHDIVLLKPGRFLKTSSGKINRQANKKAYESCEFGILGSWQDLNMQSSGNDIELERFCNEYYATISDENALGYIKGCIRYEISKLLNINDNLIDTTRPLMSLGADSLELTRFRSLLNEHFQFNVTIESLIELNSINALAAQIELELKLITQNVA